jgi:hydroxymethylpyrimidine pyrophosphatase-like HAD family hydrolase
MIELDSVHSSDNGALIVKGVNCEVFKRHPIPSSSITSLITFLKQHLSYIELYSDEQYFLENDQESELTIKHAEILQKSPTLVEDLIDCSQKEKIIRVAAMSDDPSIISKVLSDVSNFSNVLTVTLTSHPYMYPYKIFVCTQVGISKESALYEISAHLGISPNEMLGVGDTMGDWPFIKHCGYKATVANGSDELKGLVRASGNKGFVGKSVNEHGILGILNYFEIT